MSISAMAETASHILVVDDDDRLRALLEQYLREQGFFVSSAASAAEAEAILAHFHTDAMVLDVMMPKETGLAFASRYRAQAGKSLPILMLTARGEFDDRIAGLEAGADDYLNKPFAPRELVLRLEKLLERQTRAEHQAATCRFGAYVFDKDSGRLTRNGIPVYLTTAEQECLVILAQQAGTPVSRERMAQLLGDVQNERSVDVQMNRLRKKIEATPSKPVYIQTIRNAGYMLCVD